MSSDSIKGLIEDLVAANHILANQGVVDGYGHVSVRHPILHDRYLLCRRMPPAHVTTNDVLEFTLDSEPVCGNGEATVLERFIHGEIYRARRNVLAVVHSHSPSVIPLGATKVEPLRSIFHMSAFLGIGTPVFEIRDVRGDGSDMLVRDGELGQALAMQLGDGAVILMRGHGATIVGGSLREAVVRAVYTEINARLQCQAMQLGEVTYLSAAEAQAASATGAAHADRAWDLWKAQAQRATRPCTN